MIKISVKKQLLLIIKNDINRNIWSDLPDDTYQYLESILNEETTASAKRIFIKYLGDPFRKTKCKKINYELNETTVKKLQNIAKQQKFAISDIVNVICDTLPTDVYENYYQGERLNQVAKKLRQLTREEYEKHKGEKIELTIEKLAEKCGLMSGDLDKSTHKSL